MHRFSRPLRPPFRDTGHRIVFRVSSWGSFFRLPENCKEPRVGVLHACQEDTGLLGSHSSFRTDLPNALQLAILQKVLHGESLPAREAAERRAAEDEREQRKEEPAADNRLGSPSATATDAQETQAYLQNFVDCLRSRQRPNCSFEIGFRSAIACQMAVASYRQGWPARWDAKREEIV